MRNQVIMLNIKNQRTQKYKQNRIQIENSFTFPQIQLVILLNINQSDKYQSYNIYLEMSTNSNCYYTTCQWNCCNQNRDCPEDYDTRYWTSYYTSCYYYYNSTTTTSSSAGGAIAGYVIGGIIFIVIIGVIIWQCNKRKAFEAQRLAEAGNGGGGQTIVVQNPPGYGQSNTYGQPNYVQPNTYGQPNAYGQPPVPPIYSQPYVQPAPYGGGYPQQQGPIIIQS